ncbi:hypothetical protein R6Q59_036509 [Mikania micrantha]|uniref:Uncharacterized protein n=1 Tax=Mikania micrantha TaxID=192012 RepID=A0A5N6NA48_9ASTR|nr:hypothetical protein E3N88_42168 [Mikania micrantha]KAD4584711.1 hypothetical protein E3N88_22312 [Mikania micrantha]
MNMKGSIPFSWENKPGVRKGNHHENVAVERWRPAVQDNSSTKERRLPPPPFETSNKTTCHDLGLPLPPCVFQHNLRSGSRRSKDGDDPFLMAYKECTKSNKKGSLMGKKSFIRSCKYSSNVRDDSIVRVSQIPMSNSEGKRFEGFKNKD